MAATPAPFCSQCGTPLQGSTRFCTNCGATIGTDSSSPTLAASQAPAPPPAGGVKPGQASWPGITNPNAGAAPSTPPNSLPGGSIYTNNHESLLPPPPPPPIYNPYTNSLPGGSQSYAQTTVPDITPPVITAAPQVGAYQVPAYAQKPKGKRGCMVSSVILLLVLALGIGGYFLLHSLNAPKTTTGGNPGASGTPASASGNNTATATPQGSTPTVSSNAATTEQLNLQITYANVGITVISAQLASNFPDDTSTTAGSAGIVRINLRENNTTTSNPDYVESSSMLLLLPGGTTAQPGNYQQAISPAQGVNRLNWLDFPLGVQATLNQLTLRIGKQSENQMDIPLQPKADLSKYQDKISNPNTQFKYGPLNITMKTATLSYSYADQQATTGNRYVILTLSAVNNTTNSVSVNPSTYMRLQAGGNSIQPDSTTTISYSVDANTSGSGVVAFLVPQGTTSFTLVMLAQPDASPAISQVTQNFQIQ